MFCYLLSVELHTTSVVLIWQEVVLKVFIEGCIAGVKGGAYDALTDFGGSGYPLVNVRYTVTLGLS